VGKRNDTVFLPLKTKKRLNAPPTNQPWSWCTFEMLESGAMRSLSINGLRVLHRIQIEHMSHGGLDNGRLKVTWHDFEKYGVSRRLIGKSITEVVSVGFAAIEQPGRMLYGRDHGDPTQYRLTYLPVSDAGDFRPPTNDWKRFGGSTKAAKAAIKAGERKSGNGKARVKFEAWPIPP
jgi:hypothetical protein